MIRYEKDHRFRELALDGAMLVTRTEAEPEQRRTYEGPVRARWEYDRQIARAIADGFTLARQTSDTNSAEHQELTAAIHADPQAVEPYLVYGDWLQRRGDPRGELIAIQHAIEQVTQRAERQQLLRAEAGLFMLHREQLFGPLLSELRSVDEQSYMIDLFELRWHLGFICYAALPRSPLRLGINLPLELWNALLATDSASVLREISLDWSDCHQLTDAAIPETLEQIEVVLDRWWPPELDSEARRADHGLATLEEIVGPPNEHADAVLARLAALLDLALPSRLQRLVLRRCPFARRLLELLLHRPVLDGLRALDLSGGSLCDADVPLLEAHRAALGQLERLDLQRCRFSKSARQRLRLLGEFVVIE